MAKYNISFRGELIGGHDVPTVKRRFARAFNISEPARVEAFFSGKPVLLRRDLTRAQAESLQDTLTKIGLHTQLQPVSKTASESAPSSPPVESSASEGQTARELTASSIAVTPSPAASPAPPETKPEPTGATADDRAAPAGQPLPDKKSAADDTAALDWSSAEAMPKIRGLKTGAARPIMESLLAGQAEPAEATESSAPPEGDTAVEKAASATGRTLPDPASEKDARRDAVQETAGARHPEPRRSRPGPAAMPVTATGATVAKKVATENRSSAQPRSAATGTSTDKPAERPAAAKPATTESSPAAIAPARKTAEAKPERPHNDRRTADPVRPAEARARAVKPASAPAPAPTPAAALAPDSNSDHNTIKQEARPEGIERPAAAITPAAATIQRAVTGAPAAAPGVRARGQTPSQAKPGAPNVYDLRLSSRAVSSQQRDEPSAQLRQAPRVGAAIMTLALVLVGLRFWAESLFAPAVGLGAVAVSADGAVALVVNDLLVLHERSGLDTDRIALSDFDATASASFQFFGNGDLVIYQPPTANPVPNWLKPLLGLPGERTGTLSHCSLSTRECTLLRDDVDDATFLIEPRTDNILLADAGRNQLEKLNAAGEPLAVKAMDLTPPVAMALQEGILYLTKGNLNSVLVLKPDTGDFATELDTISLPREGVDPPGQLVPTALAPLENRWWVVRQSRDGAATDLLRFEDNWQAVERIELPEGARPSRLAVWAGKLLVPDPATEIVYRIAADGSVAKPFNEEALTEVLAKRRADINRTRWMQAAVLLILLTGTAGMLALGRLQSLHRKIYRPATDVDEARFDINNAAIQWLQRSPDIDERLRRLGYGFAGLAALLLIGAFVARFSAPVLLATCLVLLGLGGYYLALQKALQGYIGVLDNQLILVDHRNTYRVGRGPNVQYLDSFVMIDDVIVFLGARGLPRFAGDELERDFLPLIRRGIKIDRATLRLKLMNGHHPLLLGGVGLALCITLALLLSLLA